MSRVVITPASREVRIDKQDAPVRERNKRALAVSRVIHARRQLKGAHGKILRTHMDLCGPCCFGEADAIDPENW